MKRCISIIILAFLTLSLSSCGNVYPKDEQLDTQNTLFNIEEPTEVPKAAQAETKPTKDQILSEGIFDLSYSDVMRYRYKYTGSYVVTTMKIGQPVGDSDNLKYSATIVELGDGGLSYDWNHEFIIVNKKSDKSYTWLKGDIINVYGKFTGIKTYKSTNPYTDKTEDVDVPEIEVYYDELCEDYMAYDY